VANLPFFSRRILDDNPIQRTGVYAATPSFPFFSFPLLLALGRSRNSRRRGALPFLRTRNPSGFEWIVVKVTSSPSPFFLHRRPEGGGVVPLPSLPGPRLVPIRLFSLFPLPPSFSWIVRCTEGGRDHVFPLIFVDPEDHRRIRSGFFSSSSRGMCTSDLTLPTVLHVPLSFRRERPFTWSIALRQDAFSFFFFFLSGHKDPTARSLPFFSWDGVRGGGGVGGGDGGFAGRFPFFFSLPCWRETKSGSCRTIFPVTPPSGGCAAESFPPSFFFFFPPRYKERRNRGAPAPFFFGRDRGMTSAMPPSPFFFFSSLSLP